MMVDGYSSFLLLDKDDDKSKVALYIENEMWWEMKKYKKLYHGKILDFKESDMQGRQRKSVKNAPIYDTICPYICVDL